MGVTKLDSKMTTIDRALAYVAKMPAAISGRGGHAATFAVAKALVHGFALSESRLGQFCSITTNAVSRLGVRPSCATN